MKIYIPIIIVALLVYTGCKEEKLKPMPPALFQLRIVEGETAKITPIDIHDKSKKQEIHMLILDGIEEVINQKNSYLEITNLRLKHRLELKRQFRISNINNELNFMDIKTHKSNVFETSDLAIHFLLTQAKEDYSELKNKKNQD